MKSPLELLQSRLDELYDEYTRIMMIKMAPDEVDVHFTNHKRSDCKIIQSKIDEYIKAINILKTNQQ